MSCLSPILVRSKARDANPNQMQLVRCNKCTNCLKDYQSEWIYRIECEDSVSKHSLFATLTYDPAHVPLIVPDTGKIITYREYIRSKEFREAYMTVNKKDFVDYFKRVRKALPNAHFKVYYCYEYGDQFDRPHGHYVLFSNYEPFYELESVLKQCWEDFGIVGFEPIIPNRVDYVTKDISKKKNEAPPTEFALPCGHSSSLSFGDAGFLADLKRYEETRKKLIPFYESRGEYSKIPPEFPDFVSLSSGVKIPVPRYFRRKFGPKKDYLSEDELEINDRQFLKSKKNENRIIQDLIIKGYEPTVARISNALSTSSNVERIRRDVVTARLRRKGL